MNAAWRIAFICRSFVLRHRRAMLQLILSDCHRSDWLIECSCFVTPSQNFLIQLSRKFAWNVEQLSICIAWLPVAPDSSLTSISPPQTAPKNCQRVVDSNCRWYDDDKGNKSRPHDVIIKLPLFSFFHRRTPRSDCLPHSPAESFFQSQFIFIAICDTYTATMSGWGNGNLCKWMCR